MVRFCVYEGDMPHTYTPRKAAYRPLVFLYAWKFLSTTSIVLANFVHDNGARAAKDMVNELHQLPNDTKGDGAHGQAAKWVNKRQLYHIGNIQWKAMGTLFVLIATATAFTFAFLFTCKSCEQGLGEFNLGFPTTFFIVVFLLACIFVIPYFWYSSDKNIYKGLKMMISSEHDYVTANLFQRNRSAELQFSISDALNAQAQMAIPAFVMLSIGITLTREWTDEGVIYYNRHPGHRRPQHARA
eukprot:765676-Hanusia_phi.AAC.1